MTKQVFLAVLSIISAFLSFYFLKRGLLNPYFLIPGLLIFPIVWGLSAFLIESSLIVLVVSLVAAVIFLLLWGFSLPYLICATLLLFSLLWGFKKVDKEKKLRIKVLIEEIIPKGVGWLFFVISIILAVGFYYSPAGQGLKEGIKIPAWASEKMLTLVVPNFSQELTVNEMVNVLSKKEKSIPLLDQARQQVLKELGLEDLKLSGSEKVRDRPEILERMVAGRINQVIKDFAVYIPIVAAFIVWQVFLLLNKILIPLIVLLDLLIYSIMKVSGFVKIEKTSVEKEEIKL